MTESNPSDGNVPQKQCSVCETVQPITQFRLRRKSGDARHAECRNCRNSADRDYLAAKRARMADAALGPLLGRIADPRCGDAEAVLQQLLRRFGGRGGLAKAWKRFCDRAASRGGMAGYRAFAAIFRLMEIVDSKELARREKIGLARRGNG